MKLVCYFSAIFKEIHQSHCTKYVSWYLQYLPCGYSFISDIPGEVLWSQNIHLFARFVQFEMCICIPLCGSQTLIASVQNMQIKTLDVNARISQHCHSVSLHFQHIIRKHILVTILTPTTICIYDMNEWIFHKVVIFGRMWNDKHN